MALESINSEWRTVVEFNRGESLDQVVIYVQNGEVECETMDYFWSNKVIEGDKAFYNGYFMDQVKRLVVVPLKERLY